MIMLDRAFAYLQRVSGLTLNMNKVVFIPLVRTPSAHNCELLRDWLCNHVVRFASCTVAYSVTYLGFIIGPCTSHEKWNTQIDSLRFRADLLVSRNQVLSGNAHAYN